MLPITFALAACLAQTPTPAPAPPTPAPRPAPPTPTAAHHQFDFWLGDWEVRDTGGTLLGHNRIEAVSNGFALLEHWRDLTGGSGRSLNAYDPVRGGWHQTWVGSGGGVIQFDGGFAEGRMRMEGTRKTAAGILHDRMTWTPQPDGTVRQVWELRSGENHAWKTVFEGIYHRVK